MLRILAITNLYPTSQNPALGSFVERQISSLQQVDLKVSTFFVDRAKEGMTCYLGLAQQLCSKINEIQPNLVHVMYGGVMANIVTRAVKDRPTVVSFCGSDLLGENLSGAVRKLIARYGVLASCKAARRAAGIVVKSKNLQDALPEDVDRSKVHVIPNGIDLERFRPLDQNECRKRLGWAPSIFHVLFPANSGDPVKRPRLAQAALETFRRNGIPAEMHYLRGIPNKEVPIWLNASNVILLTSLHEGSPNIIKEALACDLPIVSVNVGDVNDRIRGIDGCYISASDPDSLSAKLLLVHSGPARVLGRSRIQDLSLTAVALRLKRLYEDLCLI
jgi:glycosyltransferase involved in cell wall biosynthesis